MNNEKNTRINKYIEIYIARENNGLSLDCKYKTSAVKQKNATPFSPDENHPGQF